MADFFRKFKRKTRGSSSGSSDNDSYSTREKHFCESLGEDIIPTEEVDEVVLALDMSSEVASRSTSTSTSSSTRQSSFLTCGCFCVRGLIHHKPF